MTIKVKNTLNEVLEDYADLGFRLEEEGDHITTLYFKENFIMRFNQTKVTKETLWEVCQGYLNKLNGQGESIETQH